MTKAPKDWSQLLTRLIQYRKTNRAPVDSMGAGALFDQWASEKQVRLSRSGRKRTRCMDSIETADLKKVREYRTLISLMLSSQTKDEVTSLTVQKLVQHNGLTPESIHQLPRSTLNELLSGVGFHNKKTDYIKKTTEQILTQHQGRIPANFQQLCSFPGVGSKMAHLFLQCCHNIVEGISVDVHMERIFQRWRWVSARANTPQKTAEELQQWLPREHWAQINPLVVGFGQTLCTSQRPKCQNCPLFDLCPSARRN
mmetsp:Transcript_33473/g.45810  ORF Transcript_33473/g.45810 Transcript_33473/m.45810 type:complete len:255 (+) Transcript_33473:58-822(+)